MENMIICSDKYRSIHKEHLSSRHFLGRCFAYDKVGCIHIMYRVVC